MIDFANTRSAMTLIDRKALYIHSNKQRIAKYAYRAPESTFGPITQEGKLAPY